MESSHKNPDLERDPEQPRQRPAFSEVKRPVPGRDYYTVNQVFWGLVMLLILWCVVVWILGLPSE
ncbi:hypothetical protein [Methanoregula formicica]|uniref:Uncharacterized protein n=1 Tax=Methanoregula formicica (strain DSM 22288 / NBRC 105244 / SMSP) TaxID=593750 RepID=L0HI91_METFS|nr:hypothetical protein [Methanoregula formicica]AGB03735.1 hypothetical protein Metfor_2750 [Methanoregula formicica SMSP]